MATTKSTNTPTELDTLKEKYKIALSHLMYSEEWARFHDHGFRLKTIEALKKLGEWAS